MKKIKLDKNKYAVVDDCDFEFLSKFTWYLGERGYARTQTQKNGKITRTLMHRLILGLSSKDKEFSDHINGDRLDNRRSNLRICNRTENSRNRSKNRNRRVKYKGIYIHYINNPNSKWVALIQCNNKKYYLGSFDTDVEAAKAYDKKASELFGEFARLNFPPLLKHY